MLTCIDQKEKRFFANALLLVVINTKSYLISTILLKRHFELCQYDPHYETDDVYF